MADQYRVIGDTNTRTQYSSLVCTSYCPEFGS